MKKITALIICLLACISVFAGNVTEQQALQKARQFMHGKQFTWKNLRRAPSLVSNNAYYIFNADNQEGFVIVSGDDRTAPILGYADKGCMDADDMPENVKAWLADYAEQIELLPDGYTSANGISADDKPAIDPLIATQWNQSAPYNLMCPMVGDRDTPTGCVATALAQVMYYWQSPQTCSNIPAYTTRTLQFALLELPATTFEWNKMKLTYSYGETGEAANAVAKLMRYVGQAMNMDYTTEWSAASVNTVNMHRYFGYSVNARREYRAAYYNREWENLIYQELASSRPVLYDGGSLSSGHQFICDGYDGNGLFHINWGWGGSCDGFFVLSLANPAEPGIGGGSDSGGYKFRQSAIIGFQPGLADETEIPVFNGYINEMDPAVYTRESTDKDFIDVALNGDVWIRFNDTPRHITADLGFGLYQDGAFLKALAYEQNTSTTSGDYEYMSNKLKATFGASLPTGRYSIRPIYRLSAEDEWSPCYSYSIRELVAEVTAISLTLRMASYEPDFMVDKVEAGNFEKGSAGQLVATITNTGDTPQETLYLWVKTNGDWAQKDYNIGCIEPGKSGSVPLTFTPEVAGTVDFKITSDEKGLNVKYASQIMVADTLETTVDNIRYKVNTTTKFATVLPNTADNSERYSGDWLNNLNIPGSITVEGVNYQVVDIAAWAFCNCDDIRQLVISEGIKTIGSYAFAHCYGLKNVQLPSTLESIGKIAFVSLSAGTSVISKIDEPFEISESSFASSINWDSENQVYIYGAPDATLYVPIGTREKYQSTFGWNTFTTIYEGEYKEAVVDNVRYGYVTGDKVATVLPMTSDNSERYSGDWLNNLTIPASITVEGVNYQVVGIAPSAFWNRNEIRQLVISEGIKTIGASAFAYCHSLKSVQLPSTLESIGASAFAYCHRLKNIQLPSTLESIGDWAFVDLPAGASVMSRIEEPFEINENVFASSINWDNENQVYIYGAPDATLYVPIGTKEKYQSTLGWNTFITIYEGEYKEAVVDNVRYGYVTGDKVATVLPMTSDNSERYSGNWLGNLTIPASITVEGVNYQVVGIAPSAFWNRNEIRQLVISEGIKTIGSQAFAYCYGLKNVQLPSTLESIGESAFTGLSNQASVISKIEEPFEISESSFASSINWDNENQVYIYGAPDATLYVPIGTREKYQSTSGWNTFTTVYEGEYKEAVVDNVRYGYVTGDKVATVLPMTSDNSEGYSGDWLNNLTIPGSITVEGVDYQVVAIAGSAFWNCNEIRQLVISEGIKTIGSQAFAHCYGLKSVQLPSTLESIGEIAFVSLSAGTSVISKIDEPFEISESSFASRINWDSENQVYIYGAPDATLYVPKGSKEKYLSTPCWNLFAKIIEDTEDSAISQISVEQSSPDFGDASPYSRVRLLV